MYSKSLRLILTVRSSLPSVVILLKCVGHRSRNKVICNPGHRICCMPSNRVVLETVYRLMFGVFSVIPVTLFAEFVKREIILE